MQTCALFISASVRGGSRRARPLAGGHGSPRRGAPPRRGIGAARPKHRSGHGAHRGRRAGYRRL